MLVRCLTVIVILPLWIAILYFFPEWLTIFFICLIAGMSAYELLKPTNLVENNLAAIALSVLGATVPAVLISNYSADIVLVLVYLAFFCVFFAAVCSYPKISFEKISGILFAIFIIPFLYTSILRVLFLEHGRFLIVMPLLAGWGTDTFAYLTGMLWGKHKLMPHLSPKKTVEGAVGGLFGAILCMVLYAILLSNYFHFEVNILLYALMGAVGSIVSQIGDFSFSLIKRNYNIKDYSHIFPGHGGMLDRFDSMLFAIPAFAILFHFVQVL